MGGPLFNIDTETVTAKAVGIGTTSPDRRLTILDAEPYGVGSISGPQVSIIAKTTSGEMQDGFGGAIGCSIDDTRNSPKGIAQIEWARDGGDEKGSIRFIVRNGGANWIRAMAIRSNGNVGIGDPAPSPSERLEVDGNAKVGGGGWFLLARGGGASDLTGMNYDAAGKNLNVRNYEAGGTIYLTVKNGRIYFNQYDGANVGYIEVPAGNMSLDGALSLGGPVNKIHGQANVGIAANANDDVIFNYGDGPGNKGHALWFHGGGGGGQGSGTKTMELTKEGDLIVTRNVVAANKINVWDSGWFQMQAGGVTDPWLSHNLGAIPKGVIVLCGASATPTEVTASGPTVAHWHDWAKVGEYPVVDGKVNLTKGSDYGAFVRMTSSQIYVRAGDFVGWHSGGWQTSGWYKVVAWA